MFLNKYSMDGGDNPQKLAAVSVYKKKNSEPILITLHTQNGVAILHLKGLFILLIYINKKDK